MYALTSAAKATPAARRRLARATRVRGITGEPLHIITIGSVAAITGDLRAVPAVSPEALARYDSTIRALAENFPALLPARFGMSFSDLEELRHVLRSRQPAIRQGLAHVRNRTQMTLRIIEADRPSGAGKASSALPAPPALPARRGTAYLRARAAAIRGPEIAAFEPVRLAVTRWIRDERRERRGRVATVYHLVPRRSAETYRRAVQRVAWHEGLKVTVTGPFPPYAFAEI